ncbi:hypothetical protein CSOJ01_07921 [Colletotrichum sojae]|uniref:Uncharacterized protein n=1 Tax=Colletotrichum sojae TaxID=2175907 RepID=A0A8H6J853_9PEZI|nr:hypothetical protein CSOJ01_07921 [Colletotrichum sojae]
MPSLASSCSSLPAADIRRGEPTHETPKRNASSPESVAKLGVVDREIPPSLRWSFWANSDLEPPSWFLADPATGDGVAI